MTFVSLRRGATFVGLATILAAPGVHAQALLEHRDLALIGGATAASVALSLFDVRIAHRFSDTAFHQGHPGFTVAAKRASVVTETVLMATGTTIWAIGRLSHGSGTADVALHTTESVASAAMLIQIVRGALGRARPYVIEDSGDVRNADPHEYQLFHGFTSYNFRSYPSMHAMASFAVASALANEMRLRDTPHRAEIAPLLYTAAAAPSLARMYLDEHWASDIVMGVFLGVFSGQKVVGYSHSHPGNYFDRKFLPHSARLTFSAGGAGGFSATLLPF
jgi:membrane-associated phospholipid phosphatase